VDELTAERQRLLDLVAHHSAQQEALAASLASERAELQQRLASRDAAAARREQEASTQLAAAHREIESTRAELERVREEIAHAETVRGHVDAERAAANSALQAALAEQRRLADEAAQATRRVAAVEAELAQALSSQQAIVSRLKEMETAERRRAEQSATERAHTEEALLASALRQEQLAKSLADNRIELDALNEQLRLTETMVASAWLAAGVGRELQRYVVSIEARTKYLLGQSSLEAGTRTDVEALRVDAVRAASLARQITRPVGSIAAGNAAAPAQVDAADEPIPNAGEPIRSSDETRGKK
jgi:chemotaxis protein MotB